MGEELLPGRVDYLDRREPAGWTRNVRTFARARVRGLYPGVDLVYYGSGRNLEYDLAVAPGADPSQIRLAVSGARPRLTPQGDLALALADGELVQHRPVAYQEVNGRRHPIRCDYRLEPASTPSPPSTPSTPSTPTPYTLHPTPTEVRFEVGAYDRTKPLIIDPYLSYSTYYGNSGEDTITGVVARGNGDICIAGRTVDPVNGAAFARGFVACLDTSGATGFPVRWLIYLGHDDVRVDSLTVDGDGNLYAAGSTLGLNFPIRNGYQSTNTNPATRDAFLVKLVSYGELLYSSLLGGGAAERGVAVAVTGAGQAVIAGGTDSTDLPTKSPLQAALNGPTDAFVAAFDTTRTGSDSLLWSTYFGGSGSEGPISGDDEPFGGLAMDASGSVYFQSLTDSPDLPVTAGVIQPRYFGGGHDAFLVKLAPGGGSVTFSTYLGGSGDERAGPILVDGNGNIWGVGATGSSDVITTPGALQSVNRGGPFDAFAAVVGPTGNQLLYSTFLGGEGADRATGLALNPEGQLFIAGTTNNGFFLGPGAQGASPRVIVTSAFVVRVDGVLSPSSTRGYARLLSGGGDTQATAIAAGPDGTAVVGGWTTAADFPTTPLAAQSALSGPSDGFVIRIAPGEPDPPAAPTNLDSTPDTHTSLVLSWQDNSDNESRFEIEQSDLERPAWTRIATAAADETSLFVGRLADGRDYRFRVRAVNAGGASPYSNEVTAHTLPGEPKPATGFQLQALVRGKLRLRWEWPLDAPWTGFQIDRKREEGEYEPVATLEGSALNWEDPGPFDPVKYTYRLTVLNHGQRSPSLERDITFPISGKLQVIPATLDFGTLGPNSRSIRPVRLRNLGAHTMQVVVHAPDKPFDLSLPKGADQDGSRVAFLVPPRTTRAIYVIFNAPKGTGVPPDQFLNIRSSDSAQPKARVRLKGRVEVAFGRGRNGGATR